MSSSSPHTSSLVTRCVVHRPLLPPPTTVPPPPKQRRSSFPLSSSLCPHWPCWPCNLMRFHPRQATGPPLFCPLLLPSQQNHRPPPLSAAVDHLAANQADGDSDRQMLGRSMDAWWSSQGTSSSPPCHSPKRFVPLGCHQSSGKWLFGSAGSLFCNLFCQRWLHSANLYGAEHAGEWMDYFMPFICKWMG